MDKKDVRINEADVACSNRQALVLADLTRFVLLRGVSYWTGYGLEVGIAFYSYFLPLRRNKKVFQNVSYSR
jgi:hypothetical protein